MRRWKVASLFLVAVSLQVCGCDRPHFVKVRESAEEMTRQNQLKQLGLLYLGYHEANHKAPSGPEDLGSVSKSSPDEQAALNALKSGQYVLLWGVNPSTLPQGAGETVLGYESSASTQGGTVLMANGSVRKMTAQEFQAAPKAK